MAEQFNKIAIGDIGTQLFYFNKDIVDSSVSAGADFTATVDAETYLAKTQYAKTTTVFTATVSTSTTWSDGTSTVDLDEYGITVTGTVDDSETITVIYGGGKFEYALPVTAGAEFGGDTESFEASETDLDYVPKIGGRTTLNDISYTVNYTATKYKRIDEISDNNDENIYMEVLSDGSAMVFQGTSGMPTITAGDVRQITWTIVPTIVIFVDDIYNIYQKGQNMLDALNTSLQTGGVMNIDASTIPSIRQDYYTTKNA